MGGQRSKGSVNPTFCALLIRLSRITAKPLRSPKEPFLIEKAFFHRDQEAPNRVERTAGIGLVDYRVAECVRAEQQGCTRE